MYLAAQDKIKKYYRIAVYSYVLPFILLGLYIIDSSTFDLTEMFFFAAFLISLLPLGALGLACSIYGMVLSNRVNNNIKKDIGYANLIMGIIITMGGFLGMAIAYLMLN